MSVLDIAQLIPWKHDGKPWPVPRQFEGELQRPDSELTDNNPWGPDDYKRIFGTATLKVPSQSTELTVRPTDTTPPVDSPNDTPTDADDGPVW